jgi:replication-associated recombination protein RarA
MFELTFSLALTASQKNDRLTVATLRPLLVRTQIVYDRLGDKHYDTISAFIKSMRGSGIPHLHPPQANLDPDAAVYYLARMLKGGEDPLFVARYPPTHPTSASQQTNPTSRMVIFASEDIGLVSPALKYVSNFRPTQRCSPSQYQHSPQPNNAACQNPA